ncbi:MAG: exodeoxyribonuclease [Solirubrobacteraceae bacterium]|nr:exodeoxyribonuclease [Solirubrobacteraceae bacterium]
MSARLLCWNVAGRVQRLPEQLESIRAAGPDLICLQEVTKTTQPRWEQLLGEAGWPHVAVASPRSALEHGRTRPLLTLTAARVPLERTELAGIPWPERVISVRLGDLEVVNVHSPISPKPDLAKVRTHEAVYRHLAEGSGPRLLCGDLNTPRKEHPDGRVWTFARTRAGKLRRERGERWDVAELALIKGLEAHGFRDAFRDLFGPEVRELSWEWAQSGGGYRLDHLIVSGEVAASEVTYLHDWRRTGLSDHSPLTATISWSGAPVV